MIARALLAAFAGVALGAVLGRGFPTVGVPSGLVMAAGLVLAFGFQRIRRGRLALPPAHAVVGILVCAVGFVSVARPDAVFLPTWIGGFTRIDDRQGPDRVLIDDTAASFGERTAPALARALPAYRAAATALLGDLDACPLDVVLAARGRLDSVIDARGDFGFLHRPFIGRPTVVVFPGTGWGSLMHHAMQQWVPCALPDAPPWIVVGVATLLEKHTMSADGRAFDLRWRSPWRVPESVLASPQLNLVDELMARDQGFLRSFFLFLHERGELAPLLARVRAGEGAFDALRAVTGAPSPQALEAEWRRWLHEDARRIPKLEVARPFENAPDL